MLSVPRNVLGEARDQDEVKRQVEVTRGNVPDLAERVRGSKAVRCHYSDGCQSEDSSTYSESNTLL